MDYSTVITNEKTDVDLAVSYSHHSMTFGWSIVMVATVFESLAADIDSQLQT